jgi:medium-chain acyl-[acyl-carrier-protein] hydrolase
MSDDGKWMTFVLPRPKARMRLFCFPYGGGGASVFFQWAQLLPGEIELCAIQLPGRETRFAEKPLEDIDSVVEAVCAQVSTHVDKPFALLGHSMGGLIAFEVARQMRRKGGVAPVRMFVSGCRAPQVPLRHPAIHVLDDAALLDRVAELGGMPGDVFNAPELLELILPALRADLTIFETYTYRPEAPLDCAITAFSGLSDRIVALDEAAAWTLQTRADFVHRKFAGDHFFLHTSRHLVVEAVIKALSVTDDQ